MTEDECNAALAEAYVLIKDNHANAVGVEDDGRYIVVLDCRGEPYSIRRTENAYYLLDRQKIVVSCSQQFEEVLGTLSATLKEIHRGLPRSKVSQDRFPRRSLARA
jgi:hypothetical protein